jgi:hypothetical protein
VTVAGAADAVNYFGYFSEIEEYFWKKRGAHLLVSPLDWAIMESWQKAAIPLAVVLKGIDRAFESYQRSRRAAGGRSLKSLAYCVDAVLDAAEEAKEAAAGAGPTASPSAASRSETFSREELRAYVKSNAEKLAQAAEKQRGGQPELAGRIGEVCRSLEEIQTLLDSPASLDLEDLERRFTALEEKLTAAATSFAREEVLVASRREFDRQLAPYRRKMSAPQLAQVERQYLQKRLFEEFGLPRLSLFYMV